MGPWFALTGTCPHVVFRPRLDLLVPFARKCHLLRGERGITKPSAAKEATGAPSKFQESKRFSRTAAARPCQAEIVIPWTNLGRSECRTARLGRGLEGQAPSQTHLGKLASFSLGFPIYHVEVTSVWSQVVTCCWVRSPSLLTNQEELSLDATFRLPNMECVSSPALPLRSPRGFLPG